MAPRKMAIRHPCSMSANLNIISELMPCPAFIIQQCQGGKLQLKIFVFIGILQAARQLKIEQHFNFTISPPGWLCGGKTTAVFYCSTK